MPKNIKNIMKKCTFIKYKLTKEERRIRRIGSRDTEEKFEKVRRGYLRKEKENKKSRNAEEPLSFGNGVNFDSGEIDFDPSPEDYDFNEERTKTLWEEDLDKWVSLYLRALGRGKPSATLTAPEAISESCACLKKERNMSLYMLHASVQMKIKYCACTPLVDTLFLMQFMPSGSKTPNAAVHFGMLDFLHVFKMEAQVSNHAFTDAINLLMEKKGFELQKTVLNNVYFQYRHIVNHSTGLIMEKHDIQHSNCYACDNAEEKTVTLDGNFQLKRLKSKSTTEANTGIFSPSSAEKSL